MVLFAHPYGEVYGVPLRYFIFFEQTTPLLSLGFWWKIGEENDINIVWHNPWIHTRHNIRPIWRSRNALLRDKKYPNVATTCILAP